MHSKLYWGDVSMKDSDLPGDWQGALNAVSGARQVYGLQATNGYRAFAFTGNDDEKWIVMLLWRNGDDEHPYTLKVYEGRHEPGFNVESLRVGL